MKTKFLFFILVLFAACGDTDIKPIPKNSNARTLATCVNGGWFQNNNTSSLLPIVWGETITMYASATLLNPGTEILIYNTVYRVTNFYGTSVFLTVLSGATGGGSIAPGGHRDIVVSSNGCLASGPTYSKTVTFKFTKGPGTFTYAQIGVDLIAVSPGHTFDFGQPQGFSFPVQNP